MNDFFNFQDAKDALMKSGAVFLSLASLFVIVALIGVILMLVSGNTPADSYANTITVSGEAEKMAVPDIARVTATIERDAAELATAQEEVTTAMNAIIAGLEEKGIDEKDIATQNYSSNPKYEYERNMCAYGYCPPSGEQKIVGYIVTHTIVITVRDLDQTGDIVAFLGIQKVSNMYGPEFTIEDPEALQEDTRAEAIVDAKQEAKRLAKELGVRLGKLVSFSEGGYAPFYMEKSAMAGVAYDTVESAPVAPELPTGEQKITASVSLTYRVR